MKFKHLPLTAAVLGALWSIPSLADTAQTQDISSNVNLDTVTVTGDRQGAKVKTNVVTTRSKDESTETDLRGLFKDEPAIGIGGGNGTSQYLYIRNMGQNSVDVKVDNAYSDSQIHYHQGRHILDPALVKIVSVQKGAGSASAGIGQTNGAVIAKTLDAQDLLKNSTRSDFGFKVNSGYNTNDGHNYGLTVFGKPGSVDFVLSGNRVKESNYKGGSGYRNGLDGSNRVLYSALDKTGYLAKIGVDAGEDHRFVLSHLNNEHKGDRTVREEFSMWEDYKRENGSIASQAPAKRKMSINQTNLEWTGKNLGFAQSAAANIYRLEKSRWSANDSRNGYAGGNSNLPVDSNPVPTTTKIESIGGNVNFDSHLNDRIVLKYGVNYRTQQVKPDRIFRAGVTRQKKQDVGVYTEMITDVAKDVTLTTGLRYDHFNFKAMDGKKVSSGSVSPSLGVIWQVIPDLSLSASHNYATRSPRMQDGLMAHGKRGVVSIASGTKAERARNTEIGFNYDNGTFGADGSYFWQNISKALGTSTGRNNHLCGAPTPQNKNECYSEIINAGKVKNSGYELGASFRKGGWKARVGVAYSKPKFYGERLSAQPEYAMRIGRTWTGSLAYRFDNPDLEIGIQHRQVEGVKKEDNFILINRQVTAADKGKKAYGVTDLSANWKPLKNDKMNVNFAVNNVFNKNYIPHAQRSDLPGAGREYRVGLNYTF
ncbi:TonB-dependent receptor domain-containing protein [Neisseria sp. 74A18]|uniref:TonB-dependent receptor domain-containing protein n=1 Tax=Neisseria sp. 74A18 TaxID=1696094 RepID=UPI0006CAF41A|nr:TonB-dependent receptor [Neisseria sp. 74A18]KPN74362.1 FetA [Neisseria sp. 74A18]